MLYKYKCRIRRIVDGDTVDCDIDLGFDTWLVNQRIRLANIDTPETRTLDLVEKRMGILAEEFVASKLPVGSETIFHSLVYKPRDMYGRMLGDFEVNGTDALISELLLEGRYAVVWTEGKDKDKIAEEHQANWDYWLEKLDG